MAEVAQFTAHRSPKKMILMVGLLVMLGGLLVLVDPSSLVPGDGLTTSGSRRYRSLEVLAFVAPWIGWFAIVVAAAFVPRILRRGVEIHVGPEGITYPPALKEVLPWDRIVRIAVRKMSIYRVLSVDISDADRFPIRPMARKIAKLNKSSGDFGDINIETNRSDGNFDELLAVVEQYCPVER
ncbi:hypothetical protein [Aurantiacibacter gilvus]|uniref:PH domain-containing protein n=1 Tax=Aurantiacibacter gilvus TaxID=3139141 RepID=A0ABU9IES3_9SPHN